MVSLGAWRTSGRGPYSTPRVSPEPTASSLRSEERPGPMPGLSGPVTLGRRSEGLGVRQSLYQRG